MGKPRGLRWGWAALAAASTLLLSAAGATAATLDAEGVLPPGQSGHVSITGLPSGTGSPHLTDQNALYESFEYRPIEFGQPGNTETPLAGVEITRDAYGVPSITGETEYDGWWGVGYAVAQDRLFQLELFRRATSGRLAEILGSGYLDDDLIARRDYYTDAEVQAMLDELPQRLLDRLQAYADGVNAWIDHVTANPTQVPGEFVALLDLPIEDWTPLDSARVGIFLARTVPSGDGVELDNALALQEAGGRAFRTLLPIRNKGRRPTIRRGQGEVFPSQPGRTRADERAGWKRSKRFINGLDLSSLTDTAEQIPKAAVAKGGDGEPGAGLRRILPSPGGSFMWAISDPVHQRAHTYNGPQLGFSIPELFVEWELHSPEFDIHGVSAAGVPVVGIGHNGRVAWGFTSGLSDEDDLFVEKVTGPETYRFRGAERQMDCRDEVFTWNTPPTDLPDALQDLIGGGGAPAGSTTERICRTVHGPVQHTGDGIALARSYAIWGRELETILGIDALNRARDIGDVHRAMMNVTWNENVIAGDSRGHIGYWHPGLHPLRPLQWDERLPYPGTGRAEWRGLLPRAQTPHVIDPPQGWLTNWNNVPSSGWTNGDGEARERLTGPFHRVRILERLVAQVARDPSHERSTEIAETSGTTAQQRPFVSERRLRTAKRGAEAPGRATLRAILAWDGNYDAEDGDGTVDPGVAAWEQFKAELQEMLLKRLGAGAGPLAGGTGSSHQFDISNGEAHALRTFRPARYRRAAERAGAELATRFGSADPATWREPRRLYEVSAQGAGSSADIEFFDRGTWNQSITVGRP